MRMRMFPQKVGINSGATETMEKRTKMSPGNTVTNSKATGTKAMRSQTRTSLMKRSSQSMLSSPMGTEAMGMKTWTIQLNMGPTSPATGATAIKMRMRTKLCPASINII